MFEVLVYRDIPNQIVLQASTHHYLSLFGYFGHSITDKDKVDIRSFGETYDYLSKLNDAVNDSQNHILYDLRSIIRQEVKMNIIKIISDRINRNNYVIVDNLKSFDKNFLSNYQGKIIDNFGSILNDGNLDDRTLDSALYRILYNELKDQVKYKVITNFTHCKRDSKDAKSNCIVSSMNIDHCISDFVLMLYYLLSDIQEFDAIAYPLNSSEVFKELIEDLRAIMKDYAKNISCKQAIWVTDSTDLQDTSNKRFIVITDLIDTAFTVNQLMDQIAKTEKSEIKAVISLFVTNAGKSSYHQDKLTYISEAKIIKHNADECKLCRFGYPKVENRYEFYEFNSYFFWWLHHNHSVVNDEQFYPSNREKMPFCPDFTGWFQSLGPFFVIHIEKALDELDCKGQDEVLFLYPEESGDFEHRSVSAIMALSLYYLNQYESISIPRRILDEITRSGLHSGITSSHDYSTIKQKLEAKKNRKIVVIDESIVKGGSMRSMLKFVTDCGSSPVLVYVFACLNPKIRIELENEYKTTKFKYTYEFQNEE